MSDQNIFETIDKAMSNLNLTKKMFLLMIITVIVLPPASIVGTNLVGEYMKNEGISDGPPRVAKLISLVDELEKDEITTQEYVEQTKYVKSAHMYGGPGPGYYVWILSIITYVFWIGYGITQWIVLTKLSKKYHHFKTSQQEDITKSKSHGNIFEIVDQAMIHIKSTKNMFLIVTIAGIIIPSLLLLGFGALVLQPVQAPVIEKFNLLLQQLEEDTITAQSYVHQFRLLEDEYVRGFGIFGPVLFVILIIFAHAAVWLAYGVKQYLILHKWNNRYRIYQEKDEEINKELVGID